MEEKNLTSVQTNWLTDSALWIGVFAAVYLAVLPMADTIALRNLALVALLICLAWQLPQIRSEIRIAWPFLLWGIYLLVFPFISKDPSVALLSLGGQWGRGLLAMLAGAGTALVLRNKKMGTAFHLGLISSVSILVHLALAAWKAWEIGAIPWGYWGRETHHADLGYTAGQATVLLAAVLVAGGKGRRFGPIILIAAGLICTALASSRAGLAFAVVGGSLVFTVAYLTHGSQQRHHFLVALLVLLLVGSAVVGAASKVDPRWGNMMSKLSAGFMGNAVLIECEGTASINDQIIARYGDGEQSQRIIASIRDGDGSRVVIFRAGLELALKNPWGLDGSRQAFQKLLKNECGATPTLQMAHAHNGWVDTALAIGWPGVLLYFAVLLNFAIQGYRRLHAEPDLNIWALVLLALSLFWMLRAMVDSVFRDHMFEMQGFVLSYALVALRSRSETVPAA